MRSSFVRTLALILVGAVLATAAFSVWWIRRSHRRELRLLAGMERALEEGQAAVALYIYDRSHRHRIESSDEQRWRMLERRILVALRHGRRLADLWERDPGAVGESEEASLLVAGLLRDLGRTSDAAALRASWKGRETRPWGWLAYEVDGLLRDANEGAAIRLLERARFSGEDEARRLKRLALLVAREDFARSWALLVEARRHGRDDADLPLYQGQVLEVAGRIEEAWTFHREAARSRGARGLHVRRLAEFELRHGMAERARETFRAGALRYGKDGGAEAESLELASTFWDHVLGRGGAGSVMPRSPRVRLLAEALGGAERGAHWDENRMRPVLAVHPALDRRGELAWLQLLEDLRKGLDGRLRSRLHEEHRLDLPGTATVLAALKAGCNFRTAGSFAGNVPFPELDLDALAAKGGLFRAMARAGRGEEPLSASWRAVLTGPAWGRMILLSAGWNEAGLSMPEGASQRSEVLRYATAHALWRCRGPRVAAAYLGEASEGAPAFIRARCLIQEGETKRGLELLTALEAKGGDLAAQAARILAFAALREGRFDRVRALVGRHAALGTTWLGRELEGSACSLGGDGDGARRIFGEIARRSSIASVWLAEDALRSGREAEGRGHYARARSMLGDGDPRIRRLRGLLEAAEGSARG